MDLSLIHIFNRHLLGGGDIVHIGRRDGGVQRLIGVGVINDMGFGTANTVAEAGPVAAQTTQS